MNLPPQISEFSLPSLLAQQNQVPWELLSDYFSQRGKFLTEVIRADVQTLPMVANSANILAESSNSCILRL